jgi:hypothetical protein
MEAHIPQIAKAILSKKSRAIVTKTPWYWHKNRPQKPMGQNRRSRNKPTQL